MFVIMLRNWGRIIMLVTIVINDSSPTSICAFVCVRLVKAIKDDRKKPSVNQT